MHYTEYDTRVAAYGVVVDGDRVLLAWWNGEGRGDPAWSLPGGGVDLEESLEEALVREVHEETGLHVRVGPLLATHAWWATDRPRPFKAVRVVYEVEVTGGTLGTVEVGGSTDEAAWVPLADLADAPHTEIVDVGLRAWRSRGH